VTSAAKPLFDLQLLDIQIEAERAAAERAREALAHDPRSTAARRLEASLSTTLTDKQAELRAIDSKASDITANLKKLRDRLYGGSIHDTRELGLIEKEIEFHEAQQRVTEDQEISLMEEVDRLEKQLSAASVEVLAAGEARERESSSLVAALAEHEREWAHLREKRDSHAATLAPDAVGQYERLRSRLGTAVGLVADGACQACRVQVPPKDIQHARGDALVRCGNCGRILFVE
jgi:predicted  nucleic acid-binding Zn-ribbon protein